jgi:hypothetical protein
MRPDSQSGCRRSWVRKIKRLSGIAHLSRQTDEPHGPDRRNGTYLRNGLSRGETGLRASGFAGPSRIRQPVMIVCVDPRAEGEMNDTDARSGALGSASTASCA